MFRRYIAEKRACKLIRKEWESDFMKQQKENSFIADATSIVLKTVAKELKNHPECSLELGGLKFHLQ